MKIAVPVSAGVLAMHFGHCEQFAIFDIDMDTKTIQSKSNHTPPPHEPGLLPKWLGELNVNQILAGGMGQRAKDLFNAQNITVITGAPAQNPEDVVNAYLSDTLVTGQNACDH